MPAPETVYHYCSVSSLLGIVENAELWASDFRFMNDTNDFKHGIAVTRSGLDKLVDGGDQSVGRLAKAILDRITSNEVCVYIVSFSERGDDNAQWSRYAGENGVAIGFDASLLEKLAVDAFFDFGRVEYDNLKQIASAAGSAVRLASAYKGLKLEGADVERISREFSRNIFPLIPTYKDEAFSAEREWRASAVTTFPAARERFRPGTRGLLPYVALQLDPDGSGSMSALLKRVVVGPGQFREANLSSITRFVKGKKLSTEVIASRSTLRF